MFNDNKAWIWWKRYGEHLTAPLILFALIFLGFMLYQDQQLKHEISENCGWAEEDYECFCMKGEVVEMRNQARGYMTNFSDFKIIGDLNDTLDG